MELSAVLRDDLTAGLFCPAVSQDINTGNVYIYWWTRGGAHGGVISGRDATRSRSMQGAESGRVRR